MPLSVLLLTSQKGNFWMEVEVRLNKIHTLRSVGTSLGLCWMIGGWYHVFPRFHWKHRIIQPCAFLLKEPKRRANGNWDFFRMPNESKSFLKSKNLMPFGSFTIRSTRFSWELYFRYLQILDFFRNWIIFVALSFLWNVVSSAYSQRPLSRPADSKMTELHFQKEASLW